MYIKHTLGKVAEMKSIHKIYLKKIRENIRKSV